MGPQSGPHCSSNKDRITTDGCTPEGMEPIHGSDPPVDQLTQPTSSSTHTESTGAYVHAQTDFTTAPLGPPWDFFFSPLFFAFFPLDVQPTILCILNQLYISYSTHYQVQPNLQPDQGYDPTSPHSQDSNASQLSISPSAPNTTSDFCICTCGRASIPQKRWSITIGLNPSEVFYFSTYGRCGILVSDALQGRFCGLDGRDDSMFVDIGCGASISLRIEWPGYSSWACQMRTRDWRKPPQPIIRSKLASEISKHLVRCINMAQQPFNETGNARWRVGPGFIEPQHVILVALERVTQGSWQPHFRLVE